MLDEHPHPGLGLGLGSRPSSEPVTHSHEAAVKDASAGLTATSARVQLKEHFTSGGMEVEEGESEFGMKRK